MVRASKNGFWGEVNLMDEEVCDVCSNFDASEWICK